VRNDKARRMRLGPGSRFREDNVLANDEFRPETRNLTPIHIALLAVLFGCASPCFAAPRSWVYEAESGPQGWSEVAQAIEDPDASAGMARISYRDTSRHGQVSFAGPMTMEQPPGTYRVVFRAKVADHTNLDPVLRLMVWQEGLGTVATRDVRADEFATSGEYQDFALDFTRAPGGLVSVTVYWMGGYGGSPVPQGVDTWIDKVTFELEHEFTAADIAERFPEAWNPTIHERPAREGPLRVLFVRGPLYAWYRLEEAAALLSAGDIARANFSILKASGDYLITGDFPRTRESLFQFDVIVLVDVDAYALRDHRRRMLADFVRAGGGLLVCGGPFAYGKGRYAGTELEDVLPVLTTGPWDWKLPAVPVAISQTGDHLISAGIEWEPAPLLSYFHQVEVRPEATVVLEAGEHPLLVVSAIGKGRAAALLATPLGKVGAGQTAFWDWPSWPQAMANTIRWLANRTWQAVRLEEPAPGERNRQLVVAEMAANRLSILHTVPEDGNSQRSGPASPADLGLSWPCELARDHEGRIYVVDYNNNRIVRVDDPAGNGLVSLGYYSDEQPPGIPGVTPLGFHFPYGIDIDSKGRIYVSDTHNARVVRFDDMTGANWVQRGDRLKWDAERNHFKWPLGVAVDAQDRLYVADSGNNRLVRLDDVGGKDWTIFDVSPSGEKLDHPSSVDIGPDGSIYVADFGNNRIVRMSDMTGADWQSIDNLDHPISVRVADDGRLYVGLAYRPGLYIYKSIRGDGHRILKTESGPRGILVTDSR
jgi:uncharacterized membrane protein/sugar lactone lactonase YvrE